MNREIKYRAVRKKDGLIFNNVKEIKFDKELGFVGAFCGNIGFSFEWASEIDILQFTGFRDCDGKEIFEGNLLAMHDGDGNLEFRVGWSSKYGAWDVTNTLDAEDSEFLFEYKPCEIKIIGNIYEGVKDEGHE